MPVSDLLSLTRVVAIAHRGGAKLRPENTVAAFDHAVTLGVDGLECDVHLSRDGVPVVIHDATLDRTTNATGPVEALTADALARVDTGYHFGADGGRPYRGTGLGVPRLADLLARYSDVSWVVEIKGDRPEVAAPILDVVRRAGAMDRVVIGGFSDAVLQAARLAVPELPTGAGGDEVRNAVARSRFWLRPRRSGFRVLQVPCRRNGVQVLGERFVRAARRAQVPVQAWIIDDPAEMRQLIAWGVTGLISDRPDIAVQVVAEARSSRR